MIYEHGYHRIKKTRHGTMMYNIHDMYIGKCLDLYGEWSWEEIEATKQYATGVVLDVGANIGTHTLAYAQYAKHVIAFEPIIGIFNVLCANLALNCIENVTPLSIAAGDENKVVKAQSPDFNVVNNFGAFSVGSGDFHCPVRTIDHLWLSDVTLIKIDVEGYELEVLRGAVETIARCKPALYVENDRQEKSEELCKFIESLDYSMTDHVVPLVVEDNYRGNADNIFPNIYSINMLCLPKV